MKKIIAKKILFILVIMILGGLGGIIADRYLFPYLSTTSFFMKHNLLKKGAEDVTVINKTEQVFVKEDSSIDNISGQASSSVVSIIYYPKAVANSVQKAAVNTAVQAKYGTGVIVTSDGLVMTYSTDAGYADYSYKAVTFDGKSYDAEVSGFDNYSNLLFLKISASNLPAVSFGNSDDVKPGEKVIEIGVSSGNSDHEYSAGLISNFDPFYNLAGKAVSSSEKLEGVFKGDFSSLPDYIGGPAVDYNGQVVGIIGSVQKNGIPDFFQIPSNKVENVIQREIKKEVDQDPVLGLYYVPLNDSYALLNNIGANKGALIYSASGQAGLTMIAGSPAQKAGLQLNDIITKINDQEINPDNTLSDILYQFKKGDQITLTVSRNGQEMQIPVQL